MRIITLIENQVYKQGLVAEHGLSMYVETDGFCLLFDTGQTGLFAQNAQKMGIDLARVDALVLSHGHYDHTGGLATFLQWNHHAPIYGKRGLFEAKYHGQHRPIGITLSREQLGERFVAVDMPVTLPGNITIMPDIPLHNPYDTHFGEMYKETDGQLVRDEFTDELFVAIVKDDQVNVLTACSHRGVANICQTAISHFNLPLGYVLGGFHTSGSKPEAVEHLINWFEKVQPKSIGICHCSGLNTYTAFQQAFGARVFYNHTGTVINF